MFWTAVGDTFPVAIAIGLSPFAIITAVVLLLAERGRSKATLFALGWMSTIIAITFVALLVVDAVDEPDTDATEDGVNLVQILFGLAFWALAWKSWRSRPEPGGESKQARMLAKIGAVSPLGAFGFGLLQGVVVIKNIPLALAGGARLGEAHLAAGQAAIALILFGVFASAGMIVLVAAAVVGGSRLDEPIESIQRWLEDNLTVIGVVVLVVIGAVLLGNGIAVLG